MNEIKDAILINKETLEVIFFKYFARLAYFAHQFLKDRRKAKDTASDLFVDLWGEKDHLAFKNEKELEIYLYTAIRQKMIDQFAITSKSELDEAQIMTQSVSFIHETLSDLPPLESSVLKLLFDGKDVNQIARDLGISQDSVEENRSRGVAFMKRKFNDEPS